MRVPEQLCMVLYTLQMKLYVTDYNLALLCALSEKLLGISHRNARLVPFPTLHKVLFVCAPN